VLLALPVQQPVSAQVLAGAPWVHLARLDYGLKACALADGVYVVEGASVDFTPANGCNIIHTGFITTGAGGRLVGFPALGIASVGFFGLTLFCAARLKAAAPHVARAAKTSAPLPLADPAT
jgi:hypothetical protein